MIRENNSGLGMAFFADNHEKAADLAKKFAGENGRLATLPDIIDARIASPLGKSAWEQYLCSNSAEYFGFSREGKPLIVVAHGIGPLSTPEGVIEAYTSKLKSERTGRPSMEGRVSQEQFLDLVDGKFGEVAIVDYEKYSKMYEYPFREHLSAWQALDDPLIHARLGNKAESYLLRHHQEAMAWSVQENKPVGDAKYKILTAEDPNNYSYQFVKPGDLPIAHLLGMNRLSYLNGESLHSDIFCKEGLGHTRLVGVQGDGELKTILPSITITNEVIAENLDRFLKPNEAPKEIPPLVGLKRIKGKWFSQFPKPEGHSMEDGGLRHLVKSLEQIGKPVPFSTEIHGYHMFVRYDIKDIQALSPTEANAYRFVSEWQIAGEYTHHTNKVAFYKADIDHTTVIPDSDELETNFETLVWLAQKYDRE